MIKNKGNIIFRNIFRFATIGFLAFLISSQVFSQTKHQLFMVSQQQSGIPVEILYLTGYCSPFKNTKNKSERNKNSDNQCAQCFIFNDISDSAPLQKSSGFIFRNLEIIFIENRNYNNNTLISSHQIRAPPES